MEALFLEPQQLLYQVIIQALIFQLETLSVLTQFKHNYASTDFVSTSEDEVVYVGDNDLLLVCGDATEGYDSIYWYGNGNLLQSENTTHHLVGDSAELTGIYQCFKLMSGGVLYQHTWRVFEIGKYTKIRL